MEWLIPAFYAMILVGVVMTLAGYSVLAERKISGWIQGRVGPNRTVLPLLGYIPFLGGFLQRLGIFQLPADGLKFLFKEEMIPGHVHKFYYNFAPIAALVPALMTMVVIPFGSYVNGVGETVPLVLADLDIGILYVLAFSSLGVYGIMLAGWAANSKYPYLGAIRASAQMVSYELSMGISLLLVFMATNSVSLVQIAESQSQVWHLFWQPIPALIFLVALFAETNRAPFDMTESETDLLKCKKDLTEINGGILSVRVATLG